MRRLLAAICFAMGFSCASATSESNQKVSEIVENFFSLLGQGQTAQMISLGSQAVSVTEQEYGPNDPKVAAVLGAWALAQAKEGHYADADANARRSLAIVETAHTTDDIVLGLVHSWAGGVFFSQGKYAEAEVSLRRVVQIQEKAFDPHDPRLAASLYYVARACKLQRKYDEAITFYRRYLTIQEKASGPDDQNLVNAINDLAEIHVAQGHYTEGEALYRRSMAIEEKNLSLGKPKPLSSANDLAILYKNQGKFAEAEQTLLHAIAVSEKYPDLHTTIDTSLVLNLADLYRATGNYSEAERFYRRAIADIEKSKDTNPSTKTVIYIGLADLHYAQGRYNEAELVYWQVLAAVEKEYGLDDLTLAKPLNRVGALLIEQERYSEAERVFERSLSLQEKALGPNHHDLAVILHNLATAHSNLGNETKAKALSERSFAILENLGVENAILIRPLNNRASSLRHDGKYQDAEVLYKRALAIAEKSFGPNHIDVALIITNLADLYDTELGRSREAEELWQRAIDIYDKLKHPKVVHPLDNLAGSLDSRGEHSRALKLIRRSTEIRMNEIVLAPSANTALRVAERNRGHFILHINALALALMRPEASPSLIGEESFQVVQLMQATGTADAVAKMSARFAKGDGELARLVRNRQDAEVRLARAEAALNPAFGKIAQDRNPTLEQRLRDEIEVAGKSIAAADTELGSRFPEYQELTRQLPVPVVEARLLLKRDEAMLVYALLDDLAYLWIVTQEGVKFGWLQAKAADIKASLGKVRGQMEFSPEGNAPPVSVDVLHELHQALIAPALPHLEGISHLLIVPDGALQSLPFGMLVASPHPAITTDADYRKVDWLARHYAMSVLPSVGSIKALRQFAKADGAKEPFAGFGDPLVGEADGLSRGKRAKVDIATVFRGSKVRGASGQPLPTLEIADVEAIRKTPRLPETADELRQIGKALKAGPESIRLQQKATETAVKGMDLSKYQTLAFATHGMMAGEVGGVGEPGLILTPPKAGTLEDDGYLAASEIAKLRLNADWTILSACNTASADGTPGAEGLSGLAKAFFYAGSRSLLVSHWPVASDATVPLTTNMLAEYKANPAQGKAEAHRKSMLALMDSADHPEFAHPIYWAPFVVVGEGGASGR